ncbi:MAG: hypothetical protein A3J24_02375 [Deltaproteobacteria bacterium RIFCSPLOWO2_02_FULL_53_8]|nr:MAG: hypothetical protein A3J24_02375 [Deltaproteobacteria bacterium RIFCSPLOWO2_02_FULL_53_8]
MKMVKGFMILLAAFFVMAVASPDASALEAAKNGGITALFEVSHGVIDLKLVDSATRAPITKADIEAVVLSPAGKKTKVELVSMKMDNAVSFMNTKALELKDVGEYTYKFSVAAGKKKGKFTFKSAAR